MCKIILKKIIVILFTFITIFIVDANSSTTFDDYSGTPNLTTIGLGRSAFTPDGRDGVSVNIYQKKDGTYVVQVIEHKIIRGRLVNIVAKDYIKAYKDKNNRICFNWNGIEYHTPPQIFRDKR